jgi:nicotinamidase/pyrazinamidase
LTDTIRIDDHDVFLVVDVQNDFCPGGNLAVPLGHEVVPLINMLAGKFAHVVLTQDWHPHGHLSFASSHSGKKEFQAIEARYGTQILWPDHCVQGTAGAAFRDDLEIPHAQLVLRKGYHREIDSYSAFYENDRNSCEDARSQGFDVVVIENACRSIDVDRSAVATKDQFRSLGIPCVLAEHITRVR